MQIPRRSWEQVGIVLAAKNSEGALAAHVGRGLEHI